MSHIPASALRKYLLGGQFKYRGCLVRRPISWLRYTTRNARLSSIRHLSTANESPANTDLDSKAVIPLRKQLKDEKQLQRVAANQNRGVTSDNKQSLEDWELTVGIEIHAQLNTPRKLFSSAASTIGGTPNTHVAFFDLAIPGTQPHFQKETLIPAIRAALALNCSIQQTSTFDRKHYFHWDQPNGYQITQFYQPFAKDGYITLYKHDGIAEEDGNEVKIGIKQIQMEQDTAKTIAQPDNIHLLDFNRVGVPLIEIITLPQIHHPATAAALVRKVQILLNSIDACILGMESGGLRADLNVSVKRRNLDTTNQTLDTINTNSYAGITNLGQRTEIKNLSSHKAVEAAIIAERNRQISVLKSGGAIESETRGWTLGSTETSRLRGKEGEVDYRYMPDPDLAPVRIGVDLIEHLKNTMGVLPDEEVEILSGKYGLTIKDALSLVALDDGDRAEYYYEVVDELAKLDELAVGTSVDQVTDAEGPEKKWGKIAGNWVLHELGGLMSISNFETESTSIASSLSSATINSTTIPIPPTTLSQIIYNLSTAKITGSTAKKLLSTLFANPLLLEDKSVKDIIDENNWWFTPLSDGEYQILAKEFIIQEKKAWADILKGQEGKIMFLVGKIMKSSAGVEGRVVAKDAEGVLRQLLKEAKSKVEDEDPGEK